MRLLWAWISLLAVIGTAVHANEQFICGDAKVEFSFEKRSADGVEDHVEADMTVMKQGRATVLRYDGNVDFIGGVCTESARGKPLVLFQAYCGGSGCHDLDNWGIFDPSDLRVLLVPNDWNRHDAERILGHPLPLRERRFAGRQFRQIDHMISIRDEAEKLGLKQ